MNKEYQAQGSTEGYPSESQENGSQSRELEAKLKNGLAAPSSRVLLRLLLLVLVITSIVLFVAGLLQYNELMRERELLEAKRDALEDEIAELQYLIDSPVDYDYIVRVAREKLGLQLPDEVVYYNDAHD